MTRLLALAIVMLPGLLACGGAAALPESAPCAIPTATPTVVGRTSSTAYFNAVRRLVNELSTQREKLRQSHPGDKFSRTSGFRVDFAVYADNTICIARTLISLKPATANFEAYDSDLDAALQSLIEHTEAGREAVRRRNVTDYRAWFRDVDAKIDAVKLASNNRRTP